MKRLKEGGFLFFVFFNVFIKPIKFFITKNLVIAYKLSTIKGFYYRDIDFATILVLFGFYHSLGEITKEGKKKCCSCEGVNT